MALSRAVPDPAKAPLRALPAPAVASLGPVPDPAVASLGPVPDLAVASLGPVPDPAPPYDDANALGALAAQRSRATGQSRRPSVVTAVGRADRPRRATVVQGTRAAAAGQGARPTGPPPRAAAWPNHFAQVLAEALAGSRSPQQLSPWTTERARSHIRRLGPLLAADQEPRVSRIVASAPACGVVEMAVVVRFGQRVRALAVRLERTEITNDGPWRCTAIEAA